MAIAAAIDAGVLPPTAPVLGAPTRCPGKGRMAVAGGAARGRIGKPVGKGSVETLAGSIWSAVRFGGRMVGAPAAGRPAVACCCCCCRRCICWSLLIVLIILAVLIIILCIQGAQAILVC